MLGSVGRIRLLVLLAPPAIFGACSSPPELQSTSVPTNTFDEAGPYSVTTVVRSGSIDSIEVRFCADPACLGPPPGSSPAPAFRALPMKKTSSAGGESVWRAEIPGQPQGTQIGFYVRAQGGGAVVTDPAGAESPPATRHLFQFSVRKPSGPCRIDSDCGPGELCDESGVCRTTLATCKTDADCPNGFRCEGRCVLRLRHCTAHGDCLLGEQCDRESQSCRPRAICDAPADCPGGTTCDMDARLCRTACSTGAECDPIETCASGRCQPKAPCKSNADCIKGQTCETGGACRFKGGGYGQACAADADCGDADDYCLVAPGKITGCCMVACDKVATCPAGSECRADHDPPQCVPVAGCM